MRIWFWLLPASVVATCVVVAGPWPLGVPGEWVWERFRESPSWFSLATLGLGAAIYLGVFLGGFRRIDTSSVWERCAWLATLSAAGFVWLWIVQEEVPGPLHKLSKAGSVLYYRGPSGYFSDARMFDGRRRELLTNYGRMVAQGEVLHFGTHPPGLIVAYWGLMDACRAVPGLAGLLEATEPPSVTRAFDEIERMSSRSPERLSRGDRPVLWLAALLVQASAAVAIFPLYGLLRLFYDRTTSWAAAALWPGVPSVAVFLPKSDVLLAFLGLCFLLAWLRTCRSTCVTGRMVGAMAAGLTLWIGMCISLAMLPVAFLAMLIACGEVAVAAPAERRATLQRTAVSAAIAAGAFGAACLVVWLAPGLNLPEVWRWNLRNHAAFYDQFPRTYWKWLCVNPLELAVAAGLPAALLAGAALFARRPNEPVSKNVFVWACAIVWGLLWLSGKNSGETARLWIFLMPWLCWLAGRTLGSLPPDSRSARWLPLTAVACQFACGAVVALHVSGFFTGAPPPAPPAKAALSEPSSGTGSRLADIPVAV